MLLPCLGLSQHFGQDVLGPDTGLGSVLPHSTQQLPRGEGREGDEAHRLKIEGGERKVKKSCSKVVRGRAHNLLKRS